MKKNWKTLVLFSALILFLGVTIISCGDDDNIEEETPDYFYHGGHSYLVVKEMKSWARAALHADSLGGYLVEIESQAEQDAVYQGILQAKISPTYTRVADGGNIGYIWIGAMDIALMDSKYEGNWAWNGANKEGTLYPFWVGDYTGSVKNNAYVNWGGTSAGKLNEPDNYTDPELSPNGQNAAAIALTSWPEASSSPLGIAGEWNDLNNYNRLYFIVEYDRVK